MKIPGISQPIALVVDDERLTRMDTADVIFDAGYHVIEATTADEAFAFLERHSSLQLLFTDVRTGGNLDGFDLAKPSYEVLKHSSVVRTSTCTENRSPRSCKVASWVTSASQRSFTA